MHKRKASGAAPAANGNASPVTAPPTPAKQQQRRGVKHGAAHRRAGDAPSGGSAALSMAAIGTFYVLAVRTPCIQGSPDIAEKIHNQRCGRYTAIKVTHCYSGNTASAKSPRPYTGTAY